MATVQELYLQSTLAKAAYADLESGPPNEDKLKVQGGMTAVQAADFAANWTVVDQYADSSGASATIFQEIWGGKRYLAIRGTESPGDFNSDYILALGFPSYLNPQFIQLRPIVQGWIDSGMLDTGFTVTGHSLGGYIAAALGTWFSSESSGIYTYNAPGLGGTVGNALDAFRAAFGFDADALVDGITNIRGTAGLSLITGLGAQLAPPQLVETEFGINPMSNHSIVNLTDSLAIYSLYASLDPALTTSHLNLLSRSTGNADATERETSLDALRKLFGQSDPTPTDDREAFWSNLFALRSFIIATLRGQLKIEVPADIKGGTPGVRAKDDFGALISLTELNPIVLIGKNGIAQETLNIHWQNTFPSQYADWLGDKNLSAEERNSGNANFSDGYLADRSSMLSYLVKRNVEDDSAGAILDGPDMLFRDIATNTEIQVGSFWVDGNERRQVLFGDQNDNNLVGGLNSDRLYGGDGADTLYGGDSDDYLEGNAGADDLSGGDGLDQLLGGEGDDRLDGGAGHDFLKGGDGKDTYVVDEGIDTILDSDGLGSIVAGGVTLAGGKHKYGSLQSGGMWEDAGNQATYIYHAEDGSANGTLTIKRGTSVVQVKQWANGDLGITLEAAGNLAVATTDRTITGDWVPQDFTATVNLGKEYSAARVGTAVRLDVAPGPGWLANGRDYVNHNYDPVKRANLDLLDLIKNGQIPDFAYYYRVTAEHPTQVETANGYRWVVLSVDIEYRQFDELGNVVGVMRTPADWDDTMQSDVLYGSDDADRIEAGKGGDYVWAGKGNDVIIGGSDGGFDGYVDILSGEDGNDTLYANEEVDLAALSSLEELNGTEASGRPGDWLYGERGDDKLIGGNADDVLFGGAGKDMLAGGAGNDVLNGDQMRIADRSSLEGLVVVDSSVGGPFGLTRYDVDAIGSDGRPHSVLIGVMPDSQGSDDTLLGGAGDDRLHGGLGNDVLSGGSGKDVITGEEGDDYILGGDDDDALTGEYNDGTYADGSKVRTHGNDYIDGGAGNDILQGEGGDDLLYGGSGDDIIWGDAHFYDLSEELHGDDYLDGGTGNDQLFGQGGNDILSGGAGDDVLDGGEGDDIYIINAGDGNDRIVDTSGKNKIIFGSGVTQDSIKLGLGSLLVNYGASGDMLHIEGFDPADALSSGGIDSFEFSDGSTLSYAQLLERGFDLSGSGDIFGTSVADRIDGSAIDDYIYAGAGNDVLSAGDGADYLEGMEGDDILNGGSGDDQLFERDGHNLLDGGSGNDMLVVNSYDDALTAGFIIGGAGNDDITSTQADVVAFNAGDGVDTLYVGNALILSLGGGIRADSLSMTMDGRDVILNCGGDAIRLIGILPDEEDEDSTAQPEITLQIIGSDIRIFDLNAVIDAFVAAVENGSSAINWTIADVLASSLIRSTDTAIGGILAQQYAQDGHLGSLDSAAIRAALTDPGFGFTGRINSAPALSQEIDDKFVRNGSSFDFQVPGGTFTDPNAGDILTFTASRENGDALPAWLTFDPATLTFSGTAGNADLGTLILKITATDRAGLSAEGIFSLVVRELVDVLMAPVANHAAAEASRSQIAVPVEIFSEPNTAKDFGKLVATSDRAWVANAELESWSGVPGFSDAHLGGRNSTVIGGSLDDHYGMNWDLYGMGRDVTDNALNDVNFPVSHQTVDPIVLVGSVLISD